MIRPMRRLLPALLVASLLVPASAAAVLTPGRTVTSAAPVTALSVTGRSVVFAVGRTRRDCGSVRLWDTASRGLWTFGSRTIQGCEEGPSGGFGIAQVATSGRRVFWVTSIGGNFTDYQLWTATPTRRSPRRIAFATAESGGPPAIVIGAGNAEGVAYAVGGVVTYVNATGARLFRTTLDSPVRLIATGRASGTGRVLVALADGRVVLLSGTGAVLHTDPVAPGTVRAIALAPAGPVVQRGRTVSVGPASGRVLADELPAGALMLDYRERAVVYRTGTQARLRHIPTGADSLLQVFALEPWQPMLLSTDSGGAGWAKGRAVSWRSGPLG
jgi:hypothetical protein